MTRLDHALRAEIAVQSLNAEIDAAKARRPSCAWPRILTPQTVTQGWAQWATAAANHQMGA